MSALYRSCIVSHNFELFEIRHVTLLNPFQNVFIFIFLKPTEIYFLALYVYATLDIRHCAANSVIDITLATEPA